MITFIWGVVTGITVTVASIGLLGWLFVREVSRLW